MLKLKIICIGSLKEKYWRDACAEYTKRLGGFCRFEIIELPEYRLPERPSEREIDIALKKESQQIIKKIPVGSAVYTLCIEGASISSEQLSDIISTDMQRASELCFIIGSSHGMADCVKSAGRKISMSPMTFPHQLARIMLCEQLYRAFQISHGGKYHK